MTEAHGGETGNSLSETDKAALASALAHEARNREFIGPMTPEQREAPSREAMAVYAHVRKKAELAEALESGTVLRVDPAEVDGLARFFDAKADQLIDRMQDVYLLAEVEPPGNDPVSKQAAAAYGRVAAGDPQAYADNYVKLSDLFKATAAKLRENARQTRTDDEQAATSFLGEDLA